MGGLHLEILGIRERQRRRPYSGATHLVALSGKTSQRILRHWSFL